MQFKTNAIDGDSLAAIKGILQSKFPDAELKLELENTDKVLKVYGLPEDSENASQVESAIKETGFEGSWLKDGLNNA